MIGDIVIGLRDALEPDPSDVVKADGRRRPWKWAVNHLYVYPDTYTVTQFGTMPDCLRIDFSIRAVYVVDPQGEEARQERLAVVDDEIDAKAETYSARVWQQPLRDQRVTFTNAVVDTDFFSDLDESGLSLVITGYQLP